MARGGRWLGGGRSHLAPPERSHGHRRRKPSAPGVFWTVLLMEQVAKATCILCKKLQRTRGGTWRFPRVSRAKSGILWLSGGTTRVRWRGASYLGPSLSSCYHAPFRFVGNGQCPTFFDLRFFPFRVTHRQLTRAQRRRMVESGHTAQGARAPPGDRGALRRASRSAE